MTGKPLLIIAVVLGLTAVVSAAAGAHVVPADSIDSTRQWQTALQLHFFHAAALLAIGVLAGFRQSRAIHRSGLLVAFGAILFSGTLYLRALEIGGFPGVLTPTGGLLSIAGWSWLMVILIRKK